MPIRFRSVLGAGVASVVLASAVGCAGAKDAASGDPDDCLAGGTVSLVVPYATGGGYDLYARAIADPLGDALGATVVVQNEPGAGGLLATNKTAVARPDGTRIQIVNELGALSAELAHADGVRYESPKLTWLARVSDEPDVLVARRGGAVDLDGAAGATDAKMVAVGPGSNTYIDALVVSEAIGLTNQIIVGFEGAPEALASLIRGEADFFASSLSSLQAQLDNGEIGPVAVIAAERVTQLPDLPALGELPGLNKDQRALLEAHGRLISTGRAIMAPPGMSEPLTECLRTALESVLTDVDFTNRMAAQGRPIGYLDGRSLSELIGKVVDETPDRYRELLEESYAH